MSFEKAFDEVTSVRSIGYSLEDICHETADMYTIKDYDDLYQAKVKEFGYENVNVGYEDIVRSVLDAVIRFFERLWVAIKSFFDHVVIQNKNFIKEITRLSNDLINAIHSNNNALNIKVEKAIPHSKMIQAMGLTNNVVSSSFKKMIGFRLYGFVSKTITGIDDATFENGIDLSKSFTGIDTTNNTQFGDFGFAIVDKPVSYGAGNDSIRSDRLEFYQSSKSQIDYSNPVAPYIENNKSMSELGYNESFIKLLTEIAIKTAEIIAKNHSLVVNDVKKVHDTFRSVPKSKNEDSNIALKAAKTMSIANSFTSMIQSSVSASSYYCTCLQRTFAIFRDAIRASSN